MSRDASEGPRPAGAGFVFVTLLLDVVGIGIVLPVLPTLVEQLVGGGESEAARWYGPLLAAYSVMQVLFMPVLGGLSDRYGRRPVLLFGLLGMVVSYLILGMAPTIGWLFFGRLLAGVTSATITTVNAYMADISTPETRARNFGILGAGFGLGFILGPALGGVLGEIGPRVPFFGAAAVVTLNLCWGLFVLPESLPADRRRAMTLSDLNPVGGIARLGKYPLVSGLAVALVLQSFAQRGLESVWVLHMSWRHGWGELQNGLSLAVVGVAATIVQGGLVRRIVPALGEGRSIWVGMVITAVAFVGYGLAPAGWVVLAVIPVGSFGAIAGPALQGLVSGTVEADEQGAIQGALASLTSLTAIFAPLVATALFAAGTDPAAAWVMPAAPFFLGGVLLLLGAAQAARVARRHT